MKFLQRGSRARKRATAASHETRKRIRRRFNGSLEEGWWGSALPRMRGDADRIGRGRFDRRNMHALGERKHGGRSLQERASARLFLAEEARRFVRGKRRELGVGGVRNACLSCRNSGGRGQAVDVRFDDEGVQANGEGREQRDKAAPQRVFSARSDLPNAAHIQQPF